MPGVAVLAVLLSGLTGVVSRGPVTPVCRAGEPCSKPDAHATLLFARGGVTRRATTDARGAYRIGLPPGRYEVRVRGAQFGSKPIAAVVPRGRYARLNVFVDTGIR
ncbi:MAG: carboxypeptidase-like regulatory domain-containing protein [Gaiellaceae bacterium]